MDLNTFRPIAKKFGLIENKCHTCVEFYLDKNKYNTPYNGWVCTYYKKSNEMGSPRMKVRKLRNDESAFDLFRGSEDWKNSKGDNKMDWLKAQQIQTGIPQNATVADLIAILQKLPQDWPVGDADGGPLCEITVATDGRDKIVEIY